MFLIQTLFWYFLLDLSTAIPQGFLCWKYTRKHYKNSCIENTKNWWGLIACPAPVAARALYCLVYFYNKILGDIFFFIFDTSRLATLSALFFILNSVDVNLCLLTNLRPMFPFYIPSGRSHNQGFCDPCRGFTKGKLASNGLIRNICWYYLLCFCCKMSADNVYYVFDTRSLGIMADLLLL